MRGTDYVIWLQELVHERVSKQLSLELAEQGIPVYRLILAGKVIEMPAWEWGLGDVVRGHDWFEAESEAFEPVAAGMLPAPGIDALRKPTIERTPQGYFIHYDILGLAYWMLSRAEEVGRTDLDEHGRFQATSSHAYQNDYLDRPVVDEWFAILRQVVARLWRGLPVTDPRFELGVSHDVDEPSRYAFRSVGQIGRAILGDIVKRRDLHTAAKRPLIALKSKKHLHLADPCNTFDWIMDVSEHHNLKSTFYFVCGRTNPLYDPSYELEHRAICSLIRRIHERGHEIGLHPSYGAYQNPEALAREARRLFKVCTEIGVSQKAWGARMHYLRWETPSTLYGLEGAGMTFDNTLGYADMPGFRCGTCLEYTAYDPVAQNALTLRLRPLIAMECSVIADRYMGLGATIAAYDKLVRLKNACRTVGGSFTLLWHNSQLTTKAERDLYEAVVGN